jgi:hypothetical protein
MKDYELIDLQFIKDNKEEFIKNAILAHERFVFNYGKTFNEMSSTWFYKYYNLATLTVGCPLYYKFYIELQKIIRKTVNDDRPLWFQSWLNFHNQDEVLNWHHHPFCLLHGYVSIDPKKTETQFENFKIINEIGKLYIGKSGLKHKVNVLEPFKGKRITIAFDVIEEKHINNNPTITNNLNVNTGFIPVN